MKESVVRDYPRFWLVPILSGFLIVTATAIGQEEQGQETAAAATDGAVVVNIRKHGATGDGVTDDGPAVKAAFEAAPAGATVFFPAGTYFFATHITITARNSLTVTGDKTAVLKAAGGRSNGILSFENCDDITVTGLRFDLNGVTWFGPGLAFMNAHRIRIHANHFFDSDYQPKMSADRYAIAFRFSEERGNEDIWISDNLIEHLQVEVNTARRVHIVNNRSLAPELACGFDTFTLIKNSFVEDISFIGNYVEDPQAYGICVASDGERDGAVMRRVLIANNTIVCRKRAPMLAAIMVGTWKRRQEVEQSLWEGVTVINNHVWYGPNVPKRHEETGIRVQASQPGEVLTKLRITGNTVIDESGIADFGIEVRPVTDAVISDNAVYGTRTGIILSNGWGRTLVQGNRVSDVSGDAYALFESGGEIRFLNNIVFGSAGRDCSVSGVQLSDLIEQAPRPAPSAADAD